MLKYQKKVFPDFLELLTVLDQANTQISITWHPPKVSKPKPLATRGGTATCLDARCDMKTDVVATTY